MKAALWTTMILVLIGIVGGMEARYQAQDTRHDVVVREHKQWIDSIIADAAAMERDLEIYRLELARQSHRTDMPTAEFLSVMADYLANDGRCEVVIQQVDWSTWEEAHR